MKQDEYTEWAEGERAALEAEKRPLNSTDAEVQTQEKNGVIHS